MVCKTPFHKRMMQANFVLLSFCCRFGLVYLLLYMLFACILSNNTNNSCKSNKNNTDNAINSKHTMPFIICLLFGRDMQQITAATSSSMHYLPPKRGQNEKKRNPSNTSHKAAANALCDLQKCNSFSIISHDIHYKQHETKRTCQLHSLFSLTNNTHSIWFAWFKSK